MKIDRWFKVLVLGGAALSLGACTGGDGDGGGGGGDGADGGNAPGGGSSDAGIVLDAGDLDDAGMLADSGVLMCSMPADPADPCGCPCCWAVEFLNTDPECGAFCSAGNNGEGCCE
jgi:hypothetical protein